jgi:cysteine desulfurase family protein (TIGR01976 family)
MHIESATAAWSERVRSHFPALRREINGQPIAYFDGPAGSQVPHVVITAVADYLAHHNANTGGVFSTSVETDTILLHARHRMADFLGVHSPHEIVFGANMTTLTFALSRALGAEWSRGDEIVVTELDHQANIAPWERIAADRGMIVHRVPFYRDSLTLDYDRLESLLSARTRLVAVGHASNAVGTINDVRRVARAAKAAGALCFVDAVHSAPHHPIDVSEIGCDFLACSAYKFFGPHVGVLWGRTEHLERFHPLKVPPAPDTSPERWETGTLNHEGIAGTAAAIDWIASLDGSADGEHRRDRLRSAMHTIQQFEGGLFEMLFRGLSELSGVRIYGPGLHTARTPTMAFTLAGHTPAAVAQRLAESGIFVWHGDFYASTVIEGLGLTDSGGVVRAGVAPYTKAADIDRLVSAVTSLRD